MEKVTVKIYDRERQLLEDIKQMQKEINIVMEGRENIIDNLTDESILSSALQKYYEFKEEVYTNLVLKGEENKECKDLNTKDFSDKTINLANKLKSYIK